MLNRPLQQYNLNLQSVNDLETLYVALAHMTSGSVPKEELLRAELASIVSALDTYMHDIIREALKYKYQSNMLNGYINNFTSRHSISSLVELESKIREMHGYKAFQAPKKIEEALNSMLGISNIWSKVCVHIQDVELKMKLIVDRRNQIVHESDIDPTNGLGQKWPISLAIVQDSVRLISDTIRQIDYIIQQEV